MRLLSWGMETSSVLMGWSIHGEGRGGAGTSTGEGGRAAKCEWGSGLPALSSL
jgi:hypothetical protein